MAQIKKKNEIAKIKKACRVTDAIFEAILKQDLKNMTERGLRDFIVAQINKRGLRPSFKTIVTSGHQAGNDIHPFDPTAKKLSGFVIIDFGVIREKYMSDMTRTIFVGKPTAEDEMVYNMVLRGELLGIMHSKIGVRCADVDRVVRESLGKYKKYFIHTLGHGVGTKIHESPRLYYKLIKPKLKENMVITIEPGIYMKNKRGIRIEDTCLITKKGCIPLFRSTRRLIVVK